MPTLRPASVAATTAFVAAATTSTFASRLVEATPPPVSERVSSSASPSPTSFEEQRAAIARTLVVTGLRVLPSFRERCMKETEVREEGISFSEGLALVSAASLAEVDLLLESGTANGVSTELLARFFNDTAMKIFSVDKDAGAPRIATTEQRLRSFPNVKCLAGDGAELLPDMVKRYKEKRIGVFVDGPKAWFGLSLCFRMLKASKRVRFCAIHDVGPKAFRGQFMPVVQEWGRTVLYTWSSAWQEAFSHLDRDTRAHGLAVFYGLGKIPFGVKGDKRKF